MTFDDACKKEVLLFQDIVIFLQEAGVSKERWEVSSLDNLLAVSKSYIPAKSLSNIQRRLPSVKPLNDFQVGEPIDLIENYLEALSIIQTYSKVYPYMNVQTLVSKIFDILSILIEKFDCAKQQLNRRTKAMKMDSKADAAVLAMLESLKGEFVDCCTKSKLAFYRVRALKETYDWPSGLTYNWLCPGKVSIMNDRNYTEFLCCKDLVGRRKISVVDYSSKEFTEDGWHGKRNKYKQ